MAKSNYEVKFLILILHGFLEIYNKRNQEIQDTLNTIGNTHLHVKMVILTNIIIYFICITLACYIRKTHFLLHAKETNDPFLMALCSSMSEIFSYNEFGFSEALRESSRPSLQFQKPISKKWSAQRWQSWLLSLVVALTQNFTYPSQAHLRIGHVKTCDLDLFLFLFFNHLHFISDQSYSFNANRNGIWVKDKTIELEW